MSPRICLLAIQKGLWRQHILLRKQLKQRAPPSTLEPKSKVQKPTPIVTIEEIPQATELGKVLEEISEANSSERM
jgi:hypothetical protein